MQITSAIKLAVVAFATLSAAHPGHGAEEYAAAVARRDFTERARRSLAGCADKLEKRGITERARARRQATWEKYSKKHRARDTASVLATDHESNLTGITADTDSSVLFSSSGTCILNPEGEVGPFWVKGELIRSDLSDGEPGVEIIIDGQFLDVETCEPIEGIYWDFWNCNSTGVYSGVQSAGNGNSNDASNLDATFCRGLQPTDSDGVAQFTSIFPGHYSGRATHHHMIAHVDATVLSNGTLTGGTIAHVGQIFWDQDLINEVEATSPYSTNTVTLTTNAEDGVFSVETEGTDSDPVLEYALLGDTVEDGIFGWITVAVNLSASYDPSYSFVYTSSGGVASSGGSDTGTGGGGGGGGGGGPGGFR